MKLIRWVVSSVLLVPLFALGSKLLAVLAAPEPWYVQALAMILLIAEVVAWAAATYWLNRFLRDFEL